MSAGIPASGSHPATNELIFTLATGKVGARGRVLDVGAGRGHMSQRLGEYFRKQGVEPRDHVAACEVVPEIFQYKGIPCVQMGFDSMIPFPSASFDCLVCVEVIEHTPRPYDLLHQAYDKLKPGGWLILSMPNLLHLKSRLSYLLTGFAELFGPPSSQMKNAGRICGHIMPLSFAHLVYGMRRAGFSDPEIHVDRYKKGSLIPSVLFYPVLYLARKAYARGLRRYDEEVWRENLGVVEATNSLKILAARSCVLAAQKPAR